MCHLCPHVKTCCCGCSLRTGALIIGVFFAVFSIITLIYDVLQIVKPKSDEDIVQDCLDKCKGAEGVAECLKSCWNWERAIRARGKYDIVFMILFLLLSVGLLIGVLSNVPVLLVAYAYGNPIVYLANIVFNVALLVYYEIETGKIAATVIVLLIAFALEAYFAVVVYSLYRTMTSPDQYPGDGRGQVYWQQAPAGAYPGQPAGGPYARGPYQGQPPYYAGVPSSSRPGGMAGQPTDGYQGPYPPQRPDYKGTPPATGAASSQPGMGTTTLQQKDGVHPLGQYPAHCIGTSLTTGSTGSRPAMETPNLQQEDGVHLPGQYPAHCIGTPLTTGSTGSRPGMRTPALQQEEGVHLPGQDSAHYPGAEIPGLQLEEKQQHRVPYLDQTLFDPNMPSRTLPLPSDTGPSSVKIHCHMPQQVVS